MKCRNEHTFITESGGPNKFGGPHENCGSSIYLSSPINDESQLYHCVICGAPETAGYIEPTRTEMRSQQICFDCHFWKEKIKWREDNNQACFVIGGHHHKVEPDESGDRRWSGCGGSEFKIQPLDGRPLIVTHNLWHQGKIPERFRNILTDNAKFI